MRRLLLLPPVRLLLALVGIAVFGLIFLAALQPTQPILRLLFGSDPAARDLPTLLSGELAASLAAVSSALFLGRVIEKRSPLAEFGPEPRAAVRDTLIGFGGGALLMSLIVLLLVLPGWYRLAPSGGVSFLSLLGAWIGFFLVAVFEEVLFRGFVFRILEEGVGTWAALFLSSLIFGAVHLSNDHATLVAAIAIAIEAGVLLTAAYLRTRSLWLPIGIHWAWNFFEGSVYGAPVSGNNDLPTLLHERSPGPVLWTGGGFGPEAGLSALLIASTAGLFLLYLDHRKGRFTLPAWLGRRRPPRP